MKSNVTILENKQNLAFALEVKNFSKKYRGRDNYAVKDVSFVVKPGEFHGFIGANGAGKTTTIKSLIGAYANFEGKISFFGLDNHTKAAKLKVGYIPEAANFPKKMSAYAYIVYMANLSGMPWKEARKFAKEKLKEVGLLPLMRRSPNTFSSGQKKKVLLAQALVNNPQILVMDEPAANLDPQARRDFFETLKDLSKQGRAIFISSHILSELEMYVDHITILDGGKVVYTGDIDEIIKSSANEHYIVFAEAEHQKQFTVWLETQKIEWKTNDKNHVIFKIENEAMFWKVSKHLLDKNLKHQVFGEVRKTLDQVYEEYVQLGSVDTKGQDVKARRGRK